MINLCKEVEEVVGELVANSRAFSAFDVTQTLRQRHPNDGIKHLWVRTEVHGCYETGLMPGYDKVMAKVAGGASYWLYQPQPPALLPTQAPAQAQTAPTPTPTQAQAQAVQDAKHTPLPGDNDVDTSKAVLYRCGTGQAVRNATKEEVEAWRATDRGYLEIGGNRYQVIE